ncbi:hypothetical protein DFH06DRAFT_1132125 [Mycena polygramma]|nr:hypothetical protein DFH06DRAFT_1132125 [Mycena polygramma]
MNRASNNSVSSSLNRATISMDDFRNDVESRIRRLRGIATQTDVPAKNGGLSHEDFKMAVVSKIPAKTNVKLEGAPGISQPVEEAVAEAGVHNVLGLTIEPVKPVSGSKRKRDNMSPPQSVVTKTGGNPRIVVANVANPAIIVVAAPKPGQATAEMTTAAQFAQTKTNLMRVPQRSSRDPWPPQTVLKSDCVEDEIFETAHKYQHEENTSVAGGVLSTDSSHTARRRRARYSQVRAAPSTFKVKPRHFAEGRISTRRARYSIVRAAPSTSSKRSHFDEESAVLDSTSCGLDFEVNPRHLFADGRTLGRRARYLIRTDFFPLADAQVYFCFGPTRSLNSVYFFELDIDCAVWQRFTPETLVDQVQNLAGLADNWCRERIRAASKQEALQVQLQTYPEPKHCFVPRRETLPDLMSWTDVPAVTRENGAGKCPSSCPCDAPGPCVHVARVCRAGGGEDGVKSGDGQLRSHERASPALSSITSSACRATPLSLTQEDEHTDFQGARPGATTPNPGGPGVESMHFPGAIYRELSAVTGASCSQALRPRSTGANGSTMSPSLTAHNQTRWPRTYSQTVHYLVLTGYWNIPRRSLCEVEESAVPSVCTGCSLLQLHVTHSPVEDHHPAERAHGEQGQTHAGRATRSNPRAAVAAVPRPAKDCFSESEARRAVPACERARLIVTLKCDGRTTFDIPPQRDLPIWALFSAHRQSALTHTHACDTATCFLLLPSRRPLFTPADTVAPPLCGAHRSLSYSWLLPPAVPLSICPSGLLAVIGLVIVTYLDCCCILGAVARSASLKLRICDSLSTEDGDDGHDICPALVLLFEPPLYELLRASRDAAALHRIANGMYLELKGLNASSSTQSWRNTRTAGADLPRIISKSGGHVAAELKNLGSSGVPGHPLQARTKASALFENVLCLSTWGGLTLKSLEWEYTSSVPAASYNMFYKQTTPTLCQKNLASKQDVETVRSSLRKSDEKWQHQFQFIKKLLNTALADLTKRVNQLELEQPVQTRRYAQLQTDIYNVRRAASIEIQKLVTFTSAFSQQLESVLGDDRSMVVSLQQQLVSMKVDIERMYSRSSAVQSPFPENGVYDSPLSVDAEGFTVANDGPSLADEIGWSMRDCLENETRVAIRDTILNSEIERGCEFFCRGTLFKQRNLATVAIEEEEEEPGGDPVNFCWRLPTCLRSPMLLYQAQRFAIVGGLKPEVRPQWVPEGCIIALPITDEGPENKDGLQVVVFKPQVLRNVSSEPLSFGFCALSHAPADLKEAEPWCEAEESVREDALQVVVYKPQMFAFSSPNVSSEPLSFGVGAISHAQADIKEAEPWCEAGESVNEDALQVVAYKPRMLAFSSPNVSSEPLSFGVGAISHAPADLKEAEPWCEAEESVHEDALQLVAYKPQMFAFFSPNVSSEPLSFGVGAISHAPADIKEAEPWCEAEESVHEDALQVVAYKPQVLLRRLLVFAATGLLAFALIMLILWIELKKSYVEAYYYD